MGHSNAKVKGSEFERSVCKDFGMWLSKGENDSVFWRAAMSGGRATVGEKEGNLRKTQSGDLSAIDSMGEEFLKVFYVECKFYKDLQIESFLLSNSGNLAKFWEETVVEADKYGKTPLLIAKQNYKPVLVVTTLEGSEHFALDDNECDEVIGVDYTNTVFHIGLSLEFGDETLGREVAVGYFNKLLSYADPDNWNPNREVDDG